MRNGLARIAVAAGQGPVKFFFTRLVRAVLQLFIFSLATFACLSLAPGDYYSEESANPQMSVQSLDAERHAEGLDQSWVLRYGQWLRSSARGEFGTSLAFGIPVKQLVLPRISRTLSISVPAFLLSWIFGLGGALLASRWRVHGATEPGFAAGAMVPDVIAVSLLLWAVVWAGFSVRGPVLPLAALTLTLIPIIFLHASGALAGARELAFVRIAASRGLRGIRFWFAYVLPAAAGPLISLAGLSLAAVIGSSFAIEALTGWPGLGTLFLGSVQARDYPVVVTIILLLAAVLIVSNALADIAAHRLDPRVQPEHR